MIKNTFLIIATCIIAAALSAQNQNISGSVFFDGEPYIAINPKNSQHIVVAWMGYKFGQELTIRVKTTFDGGKTWSSMVSLPHYKPTYQSADVSLGFDNSGTLYATYVDYRKSPDSGVIYILSSTNGGLHWGNEHVVADLHFDSKKAPIDRPWMVIDNSTGPFQNRIYVTSKPAPWINPPNRGYYTYSSNSGITWEPLKYIDTTGYFIGNFIAQPMVAPVVSSSGVFHCIYPSYVPSQNILPVLYHCNSFDGGKKCNYHKVYEAVAGGTDTNAKAGYLLIANPADSLHLVFIAADKRNGDLDVSAIESKNGGKTWSAPQRINDDALSNGILQDLVWGAFDKDGDLVITWRDRRSGSGTGYKNPSEIWGSVRWKDSTNFSKNFKVSDSLVPYNNFYLSANGNDFMGSAFRNDTLYSVWGDVRSGKLEIWFQKMALRNKTAWVQKLYGDAYRIKVYPNPSKRGITLEGAAMHRIEIFRNDGAVVKTITCHGAEVYVSVAELAAGNYWLRVSGGFGEEILPLVKD